MQILIDGYDFTKDIYELPVIDYNLPEWGTLQDRIINESLTLEMSNSLKPFFETGKDLSKYTVTVIDDNGRNLFYGFIDNSSVDLRDLIIYCKSYTSVLFNGFIQTSNYAYVIDDAYAVDIVKDLLDLAGLTFNTSSYNTELQKQKQLNMTFDVTTEKLSYTQILENLMDITCSILYIDNNEFYYEMYNPDASLTPVIIDDKDWIEYPTIDTPPAFTSQFVGVDVRFGNDLSLNGLENPTRVIDMSYNNIIYTDRFDIAQYISDLYDYLGTHRKNVLKGTIRKELSDILKKEDSIKWNGVTYELINVNNNSQIYTEILAEAII